MAQSRMAWRYRSKERHLCRLKVSVLHFKSEQPQVLILKYQNYGEVQVHFDKAAWKFGHAAYTQMQGWDQVLEANQLWLVTREYQALHGDFWRTIYTVEAVPQDLDTNLVVRTIHGVLTIGTQLITWGNWTRV